MEITEEFGQLYEDSKVFKSNRVKDNQDRRRNIELTNTYKSELDKFAERLKILKLKSSKDIRNVDIITQIKTYIVGIENNISEIRNILDSRSQESSIMESFDLKVASSLLPSMDGNEDTTKKLIDSIMLYAELLKTDHKKYLINYVLKTRLSENAKIRLEKQYDSVENLIKDMKDNFVTKKSATTISNLLHNARQQGNTIAEFANNIEQLLSDLSLAQAGNDEDLLKVLRPVNEKIAINSFCNGIRNHELKTILKSRNCQTLKDAINVATDEELNTPSKSNVFYCNKRGNYNNYRNQNQFNKNPFNQNYSNRGRVTNTYYRGYSRFNTNYNNNRNNSNMYRSNNSRGSPSTRRGNVPSQTRQDSRSRGCIHGNKTYVAEPAGNPSDNKTFFRE